MHDQSEIRAQMRSYFYTDRCTSGLSHRQVLPSAAPAVSLRAICRRESAAGAAVAVVRVRPVAEGLQPARVARQAVFADEFQS
jgi:hypothetical protein